MNAKASKTWASAARSPLAPLTQIVLAAVEIHIIQRNQHQATSTATYEVKAPLRMMERMYIAGRVSKLRRAVDSPRGAKLYKE